MTETTTTTPKGVLLSFLDSPHDARVPMTREQTETFTRTIFMPEEPFTAEVAEKLNAFPVSVMQKRLQHCPPDSDGTPVSIGAALFVCSIAGNVGEVVMWAYTLNRIYNIERKMVTVTLLADHFPWGFPTKEEFARLWDSQKDERHHNLIDNASLWVFDEK